MEERTIRTYPHDIEDSAPQTVALSSIEDIMKIFPLLVGDQRGQMVTTVMAYEGDEIPLHYNEGEVLSYGKYLGLNLSLGSETPYSKKEAHNYAIWLTQLVEASNEENEDLFAWVSINKYDIEDEQIVEEVASLHWMISNGEIFSISHERFLDQEESYFEESRQYAEFMEKKEMQRQMMEPEPAGISVENQLKILKILSGSIVEIVKTSGGSTLLDTAITAVVDKFKVPSDEVHDALKYALEMEMITLDSKTDILSILS